MHAAATGQLILHIQFYANPQDKRVFPYLLPAIQLTVCSRCTAYLIKYNSLTTTANTQMYTEVYNTPMQPQRNMYSRCFVPAIMYIAQRDYFYQYNSSATTNTRLHTHIQNTALQPH